MAVSVRLHLYRSPLKRLSSPAATSNMLRDAIRAGLWSSFCVLIAPADLGREEARGYAGEDHLRGEAVQVGNAEAAGVSGKFRLCHSIGKVIGVLPSTLKS
jgi:hypothetical protein